MPAELRHDRILRALDAHGRVRVAALAAELDVAEETIRRDLDALATQGRVERVHGGAIRASTRRSFESTLADRVAESARAKRVIARKALELLPDDASAILIDAGSTALAFATELAASAEPRRCSIITNSLPAAEAFAGREDLPVFLIGGQLRPITQAVVGAVATRQLSSIRVDAAFLGTNGLDAMQGCSTPDSAESETKAAFIAAAAQTFLLADSEKFGRVFTHRFATLDQVDALVTDAAPPAPLASALHDASTEVVFA